MAFTQPELDNIANAVLDYYLKGPALAQTLQSRPLYERLRSKQTTFPGGKADIRKNVKGAYTTTVAGYTHNDTVTYANPANIKQAAFDWKEHHAGIGVTLTELKHAGISVVDSARSESTSNHSRQEVIEITNLLEDKLDDLMEGWARDFTGLIYDDGTSDAKALAGLQHIIVDDPTTGTLAGLDRATVTWWRNRARTAAHFASTAVAGDNVINTGTEEIDNVIHSEMRQLRRYGGKPDIAVCGSDFLDALCAKLREKGNYTDSGWTSKKTTDISMADVHYGNVAFVYEPHLDDASLAKRCYILDTGKRGVQLCTMDGEDMKKHTPARPHDSYVMYRAVTWTGQMVCWQPNSCGVYDIA